MARVGGDPRRDLPANAWRGLPRGLLSVGVGGVGDQARRPPVAALSHTARLATLAGPFARGVAAPSRSPPGAYSIGSQHDGGSARRPELSLSRWARLDRVGNASSHRA